jgi:hypothetical protein
MAQLLQAFCVLLAVRCHHIVTVPYLLSNCCPPIAILKTLLPLPFPYYIDKIIVIVMMAVCADGVFLFPLPMEHITHHPCCHQPQWLQSDIGCSSLPSQHKADCCVKQGQIVGVLFIGLSLLLLRYSCCTTASCLPPSPLCRIP